MEHWYVIQTKPRQEVLAQQNLERQGYKCFLPRIKQWKKKRGERQLVEKTFFPNYLFIRLDLCTANTAPIRSSRGVNKIVRFGNEMVPVSDPMIDTIKQRSEAEVFELDNLNFKPGQQVQIENGALAGITAIFQEKRGEDRVLLLLNMLGKQQRLEIPTAALDYATNHYV